MIAFDNGPANGDYARYIDNLMKNAAAAASAGILTDSDSVSAVVARQLERLASASASPTSYRAVRASYDGPAERESRQTTGFVTPAAATPTQTAAAAIASALMSGQVGQQGALTTMTKIRLAAIALGIVLVLVGLLSSVTSFPLIAVGVAAIVWSVRTMFEART